MPKENLEQKITHIVTGVDKLVKLASSYKDIERNQKKLIASIDALNRKFSSRSAIARLDTQAKKASTSTKRLANDSRTLTKRLGTLNKTAAITSSRFGLLGSVVFGSLISRGVAALTNVFITSTTAAADFLVKIAEIQTISQNAQQATGAWSRQLRKLSDDFGTPLIRVTEAAYQALSNQVAEGAEATKFLAESQRLATITASTSDNAVLALTAVLNSYSLGAEHAREVSDALFRTQELGRLRLDEIAGSLGRVTILASQLGISYQEVFASLDTLSIKGVDVAQAMTGLRAIMLKLVKPTKPMLAVFKKWEVTSGAAAIKSMTFAGVLRALEEHVKGTGDEMAETGAILGRLRAIVAKAGLTFDDFTRNLEGVTNASDSAQTAFETIMQSVGKEFQKELNRVTNFFTVDLGVAAVKAILLLTSTVGGFVNAVELTIRVIAGWAVSFVSLRLVNFIANIAVATRSVNAFTGATVTTSAATNLLAASLTKVKAVLLSLAPIIAFEIGFQLGKIFLDSIEQIDIFSEEWTNKFASESDKRIVIYNEEMALLLENTEGKIRQVSDVYKTLVDNLLSEFDRLRAIGQEQRKLDQLIFERRNKDLLARNKNSQALIEGQERYNHLLNLTKQILPDLKGFTADQIKEFKILAQQMDATTSVMERIPLVKSRAHQSIRTLRGAGRTSSMQKPVADPKRFRPFRERTTKVFERLRAGQAAGIDLRHLTTSNAADQRNAIEEKSTALLKESATAQARVTAAVEETTEAYEVLSKKFSVLKGSSEALNLNLMNIIGLRQKNKLKNAFADEPTLENIEKADKALAQMVINGNNLRSARGGSLLVSDADMQQIHILKASTSALLGEFKTLREQQLKVEGLELLLGQLKSSEEILKQVPGNFAKIAEKGIPAMQAFAREFGVITKEFIRTLEAINTALKFTNIPESPKSSATKTGTVVGGMITRAHGGSIGKDSQNVLVDPREFIMNSKQSSKFLPQLIAMNSGSRAFESGGPVTNNNIGDINVNVAAQEGGQINARTLGNQLRRELRRNTVRLN